MEQSIVLGEWKCPKCGCQLSKRILMASNMAVGIDTNIVREVCPNDGITLEPVRKYINKFKVRDKTTGQIFDVMAISWGDNPVRLTAIQLLDGGYLGMPSVTDWIKIEGFDLIESVESS